MGKYIDWYINILWLYYSSKWWTGQKGTVYVIKDFIKNAFIYCPFSQSIIIIQASLQVENKIVLKICN